MKLKSVWVVMVASVMLAISTQTDFAFAALSSLTSSSSPQTLQAGSWAVFATGTPSLTPTGTAYGPITPWAQTSCSSGSTITRTVSTGSWSNGSKTIAISSGSGLTIGISVTGTNINVANGPNRITNISGNSITLTNGSNSSAKNTVLTFSVQAMLKSSTWTPTGTGSSNKITVKVDSIALIANGMTVSGTGIVSSGTNTVTGTTAPGGPFVTLAIGANTSTANTILTFNNPVTCTNSYNEFFSLNNSGTIDVAKVAFTITPSVAGAVTLQSCSTLWTEVSGTCNAPGVISTITTDGTSQVMAVNGLNGNNVRLRAVSTVANATISISVSVSTSDLRSATITNQ